MNPSITIVTAALAATSRGFLPNDVSDALWRMSHEVAIENFMNLRCIALIAESNTDAVDHMFPLEIPVFHVQLPLKIIRNSVRVSPDEEFPVYDWDTLLLHPINAGCLAFVIQTSDVNFMVKTFARLFHSPKSMNRNNRKYLYLPEKEITEADFNYTVAELYESKEIDFMPDLVIAKVAYRDKASLDATRMSSYSEDVSDNVEIALFTHRFVGPKPQSSERVYLDTWIPDKGFIRHGNLYPNKIANLMGKELMLTFISYPPITVVEVNNDTTIYDGLEYLLIKEWAKSINFSSKVLYDQDGWWGEIYPNGSGTGLVGHLSMDMADVSFTVLFLWLNESQFIDFSSIYYTTQLTTVLPKPKLLPEWTIIIAPFDFDMWVAVGGSILLCSNILYVVYKLSVRFLGDDLVLNMFSNWTWCFLCMMQILVEQTPDDRLKSDKKGHSVMRHLITWFILFYYVITTAYGGGLACILTLPRYELPIDTPYQMADHNSKWGTTSDTWINFLKESLNPKMKRLAENFIIGTEEFLAEKAETAEIGLGVERLMGGHFALPPYINERTMKNLRLMKEAYDSNHCAYYVRKGSPYKKSLNTMLQRARDTGLFLYWEGLTTRKYLNSRDQLAVTESIAKEEPVPSPLRIQHISGSAYLLMYGLSLATVAFFCEIIYYTFCGRRK